MYCADGCCGYSHDRKCCNKIKYVDFSTSNYFWDPLIFLSFWNLNQKKHVLNSCNLLTFFFLSIFLIIIAFLVLFFSISFLFCHSKFYQVHRIIDNQGILYQVKTEGKKLKFYQIHRSIDSRSILYQVRTEGKKFAPMDMTVKLSKSGLSVSALGLSLGVWSGLYWPSPSSLASSCTATCPRRRRRRRKKKRLRMGLSLTSVSIVFACSG